MLTAMDIHNREFKRSFRGYNEDEIVSSDVIGISYGSLFDATQTKVMTMGDKLRMGLGLWARLARRPALYRLASGIGVRVLRLFGRAGWIRSLPLAGGWTAYRDLPRPASRTFMEQYRAQQKGGRR